MKFVKSAVFWIIALPLCLLAFLFGADNSDKVALTFLDASTSEESIYNWMVLSFFLGVLLTWLFNVWTNAGLRVSAIKARSQVKKTNQTLDKVRAEKGNQASIDKEMDPDLEVGTEI
jgi:uncharacterized membrane protein YciS (DUF1049 family)